MKSRQTGSFTIHSFDSQPLDTLDWSGQVLRKLVIPADSMVRFSRELEALGFGEAGIYPDLDHLSSELARVGRGVGRLPT